MGLTILGLIIVIAVYVMMTYNGLVSLRTLGEEAWSGIDVQLKRRYDLIPNLVETVKGYASHESATLEQVTAMRTQAMSAASSGNIADRIKAEGMLSGALTSVMGIAEAYPDLKANTNYIELQQALQTVESELQSARRYYNGAARNLNIKVDSFPSNLIAQQFNFNKMEFFEIENAQERENVKVSFS